MIDFDDFDDLLGPLRTPATPAELAAEHDVVDLMVAAHHSSKGNTMFTSRRARVATLIAAGIIGFGGVAAAGPKVLDRTSDDPPSFEEVEPEEVVELVDDDQGEDVDDDEGVEEKKEVIEEQVVEEQVVEEQVVEEVQVPLEPAAVELVDDPATEDFDETFCIPDGNHGKTVSAVARGEDLENEVGTISEGDDDYPSVPDAAHSSCGKTVTADVQTDDQSDDDGDDVEKQEVDEDHDDEDHDDEDHDDDDHDEESDDHEKSDASTNQHSRSDKKGNSGHSGRGKSDD